MNQSAMSATPWDPNLVKHILNDVDSIFLQIFYKLIF